MIVIGIAGWKSSGKTTLAVRLIAELVGRGLRVASIKHAHHAFDIDHAGTDSHRHRAAGARETAIVSARRWALMHELDREAEPPLEEILGRLAPCDVVIVEGYKRAAIPKIEVRRREGADGPALSETDERVIAIAADHAIEGARVATFGLDEIGAIADLILGLGPSRPQAP
jgi:molybdopterin-guanine dinucleotide biosynthesis protein B